VVVVGAGAVGKVYASHLVRAGAEVVFRVRRPEVVRRPFVVHPLNGRNHGTVVRFDVPVLGSDAEVEAFRPDVALLTVPADALRGDWLAPFLRACGDALVVALEPGVDEAAVIRAARPDVRLAQGIITLIAYEAPLPGETRFAEPGTAVWYPPVGAPFAGEGVEAFARVLREGGMRTRVATSIAGDSAFGTIAFATTISGIHAAGWSFAALRAGDDLALAAAAAAEAAVIAERQTGVRRPFWFRMLGPRAVRWLLAFAERVLPLPLETYIRVHFTKVGAQTKLHLANAIAEGEKLGLPVGAIRALADRVEAHDRAHAA